jgi:hypothetical protein
LEDLPLGREHFQGALLKQEHLTSSGGSGFLRIHFIMLSTQAFRDHCDCSPWGFQIVLKLATDFGGIHKMLVLPRSMFITLYQY